MRPGPAGTIARLASVLQAATGAASTSAAAVARLGMVAGAALEAPDVRVAVATANKIIRLIRAPPLPFLVAEEHRAGR
jgi:hypothetical protein